jgi:hypothetical protein
MKPIRLALIGSALALLGGCVAVPVDSGYYGAGPGYYAPAPAYYGAPYYVPSIGIGIYGGSRGYRYEGRRDRDHGYRDGRGSYRPEDGRDRRDGRGGRDGRDGRR